MSAETLYLRTALASLPAEIASKVRALCSASPDSSTENTLDALIRFVTGADHGPNASADTKAQWVSQRAVVEDLKRLPKNSDPSSSKRDREDDDSTDHSANKRQKPSESQNPDLDLANDPAVYALQSVSASSPVRKKVNILIHKHSIRFINPTSNAIESTIALSNLTRSFLVPTRGKTKAHWTVIILPNDTSDRGNKQANASAANQQVIFGLDAMTSTPLITTDHTTSPPTSTTIPKGSETYPALQSFLSHLGLQIIEPKPNVFKSACTGITAGVSASEDGIPGVEAYRGAKVGSLWFAKEGILWGESKPCEFWPVDELIPKSEAVRVVGGASGQRTLTVVLTRKNVAEDDGEDGEDLGVESEFGMVDARERPGIEAWTRAHKHRFGKKQAPASKAGGSAAAAPMNVDEEDEEDEDFEPESESDGGSATSSSDEDEDGDDDAEGENDAEGSDAEEDDDDEIQELKPEHHPLLQPGAMPKMSRGMVDLVAGMVEEDMADGNGPPLSELPDEEEDEMEQDELED